MKNSSLRRELLWFVFAIGAAVLALGAWDAWQRRGEMVEDRKTELRHVLDLSAGILRNGKQSVSEGMPLAEAKRNVAKRLSQLRYGADGYVGAFGDDYALLVHPDPKLVGTNVRDIKDVDGLPIFQRLYAGGKAGGGYVHYRFPRPGAEEALPKISYATYDAEWGWLVFTGLYVDDVDAAFYQTLWRQGGATIGLLVLLLLAALRFPHPCDPPLGRGRGAVRTRGQRRSGWRSVQQPSWRDRAAVRSHGAHADTVGSGLAQHRAIDRVHRGGLAPDRGGQPGPVGPHRKAGGRAGTDGGQR